MEDQYMEEIVRTHMSSVYAYVRRYTGNADMAADITQETFVKVWKNLHKFDKTQSFKAWLFTIAKRTAIDWLRKRRFEEISEEFPDPVTPLPELIDVKLHKHHLALAIAQLPANQRLIIGLRLQDLQFHEIAERLAKPLNTVKSVYYRAVQALKRSMHQNN